ncbi:hypothetical protein HPB47_016659, partial [Ixodes persulcatus]
MTETTLTLQDISNQILENKSLQERTICLEQDLAVAKKKIAELEEEKRPNNLPEVTKSMVMQSDKSVKFLMGLVSTAMFNALLQFLLSIWNPPYRICLDPEQKLILVLMRLRLGLITQDLACQFGTSACT